MICGLLTPDAGEGTVLGFDVSRESRRIKREVGYMTQHFSFYEDLTIEENLDLRRPALRSRAARARRSTRRSTSSA